MWTETQRKLFGGYKWCGEHWTSSSSKMLWHNVKQGSSILQHKPLLMRNFWNNHGARGLLCANGVFENYSFVFCKTATRCLIDYGFNNDTNDLSAVSPKGQSTNEKVPIQQRKYSKKGRRNCGTLNQGRNFFHVCISHCPTVLTKRIGWQRCGTREANNAQYDNSLDEAKKARFNKRWNRWH